jgi:uncharacterized RDD family membrane protein YckC
LTFGLSLFILPPLFPIVAFFYNGLTVSGYKVATPGMRVMDLKMRLTDSARVPFLNAAVHAVLLCEHDVPAGFSRLALEREQKMSA